MTVVSTPKSLPVAMLVVWAVLVAGIVLAIDAPAIWLVGAYARIAGLQQVEAAGSVWDGELKAQQQSVPIQAAWSCHPVLQSPAGLMCLLQLKLGNGFMQGTLQAGFGQWRLTGLSGELSPELIQMAVPGTQLAASVAIKALSGSGGYSDPAGWQFTGDLDYAGGPTTVALKGQSYSLPLPPVHLSPGRNGTNMQWELRNQQDQLLARWVLEPKNWLRTELTQRLLALSPLYQGVATEPESMVVQVREPL